MQVKSFHLARYNITLINTESRKLNLFLDNLHKDYKVVHFLKKNCSFHIEKRISSNTRNTEIFPNSFSFHYFYNKFPEKFQFIDPLPSSS